MQWLNLQKWSLESCNERNYFLLGNVIVTQWQTMFSCYCQSFLIKCNFFCRCFENFSPHCTVGITPYGFGHLLCASLLIDLKPGAQETLAKITANKRKAPAKQTPATHRTKRRISELNRPTKSSRKGVEHEYNDENILDLPKLTKAISLKVSVISH